MKKRILSLLLAVLCILGTLPLGALPSLAYGSSASTPLPSGAYKSWKQTDPRWSDVPIGIYPWYDKYGNYHYYNTVGHAGCYISSIAILCNAYGLTFNDGSEINPGSFGEKLYDNGKCTYLTSDGSMYAACSWAGTMIKGIEYVTKRWFTSESDAAIAKTIAGYLNRTDAQYGVVVGVRDHFVAVDYVQGNKVYICDPGWSGREDLFASYSQVFTITVFKFTDVAAPKPPAQTYTVTYNANGGTQAPAPQTKTEGQALTLHSEKPSRVGYTFLGWATAAGGSVVYQPSASYTKDADLTLYAVWKERDDCEIWRVSSSNSLNIRTEPTTQSAVITALPPSVEIAVTEIRLAEGKVWGKIEQGWCALDYCTYIRGALFTLKYDANGGHGAPKGQPSSYGQALSLSSAQPVRENYNFLGWSADKNATEPTYLAGGQYTNLTATNPILYAVWQKAGSSIKYDANGGKNAPAAQHKPFGESIKLSQAVPTRTGYDFVGWSASKTGEVEFRGGDVYALDENITLYAVWKKQVYTVSFDGNGIDVSLADQQKTYGEGITLSGALLSRPDYLFLGWSTDPDATKAQFAPGDNYTLEGNKTLYAVWRPHSYLISFDPNGGRNAPDAVWKYKGQELSLPKAKPSKTGYVFLGWALDPQSKTPDFRPSDDYTLDQELTLYAVWGLDCYVLSFDPNGGENPPDDQIKEQDTTLTLSETIPTRQGYTFLGWASTRDATEEEFLPGGTYQAEGETTLYAVWQVNSYYLTVQYVYEDGQEAAPLYMAKLQYGEEYHIDSPLLAMATPSERTVQGEMGDQSLEITVVYYYAPREMRILLITRIGDVTESSLRVSGTSVAGDGTLQYGISLTPSPDGVTVWQDSAAFADLAKETDYYVFARIRGSTYYEDVVSEGVRIRTVSAPIGEDDPNYPGGIQSPSVTNPWVQDPDTVQQINFVLPIILVGTGLGVILITLLLYRRE